MKKQFNVANKVDGKFELFSALESDFNKFELYAGMPVRINNNRILSNQTQGRILGFKTNAAGTALCKVQWLEGAPPLMVKCEAVECTLPRSMWVLVQHRTTGIPNDASFSTGDAYWNAGRGLHNYRFFDHERAITVAQQLSRRHNTEIIVMRVDSLCNGSSVLPL